MPRQALLLCLAMVLIAIRADAAALRLQDVLQRVAEIGPDGAVARAQVGVARAEVATARMVPNPGFGVNGGVSEPIIAASLQLRLPIFGQRGAHIRAAERGVQQTELEAQLALWHLRHDARVAYYNAGRTDEEVSIAVEVEQLTGKVADMARERFDVGSGSRLEREQAALAHVRSLQDVSDRRAAARVAKLELARLLGTPAQELGPLADPLETAGQAPELDTLLAQAREQHPELRALWAERVAALARAHAARADRRPLLIVDLGAELLDPSTCATVGWSKPLPGQGSDSGPRCVGPRGGLSVDLPIFNINGGPIQRAEAEARVAEYKAQAAQVRVESAVRAAFENLTAAQNRARFFTGEYVPAASRVEQMAREGFAAGRTGLLPLLEAERAVLEARLGRAEAQQAVQSARADLEEASGVPLSTP